MVYPSQVVTSTDLTKYYRLLSKGKVRELYEIDDKTILFVATDRVSAFDVVLKNGIPSKGALLTILTAHWFDILTARIPDLQTHFLSLDLPTDLKSDATLASLYKGRCMQVRKLKVFPLESIVRGYITGSAWAEYRRAGTIHGMIVKEGLKEGEKLEKPLWTPSTKAKVGEKDENISPEQGELTQIVVPSLWIANVRAAASIVGQEYANRIASLSLQVYTIARDYAAESGIIIADTKLEFALDESVTPSVVVLVDEVLTPDSSRFWNAAKYGVGRPQDSLDKQCLRDWLVKNELKGEQDVEIPAEVVERMRVQYVDAYERLTGKKWDP